MPQRELCWEASKESDRGPVQMAYLCQAEQSETMSFGAHSFVLALFCGPLWNLCKFRYTVIPKSLASKSGSYLDIPHNA